MKKYNNLIIVFLACFLIGCVLHDRNAWTVQDSWFKAPQDNGIVPWDWDEKQVIEVKPESQKEAQYLLNEKQIIKITDNQANNFAGLQIQKTEAYLYLIRGVYLNEGTGNFSIFYNGKQLWVYHGSLGHSAVPMKRKALIVSLGQMPEEIFITCMMDE